MTEKKKTRFSDVVGKHGQLEPDPTPDLSAEPVSTEKADRKPGKKSDKKNYTQVTVYLRKAVHQEARKLLIDEDNRQFSDLVDELVNRWITDKRGG